MNILSAIGAIAAVVAAIASVKALYPKARPIIERPRISLAIHHANTRRNSGFFLARNGGARTYEINDLCVRCEVIDLPEYNLVAVNQWPGQGMGGNGAQKLPLAVEGHTSKQVFFHTKEVRERYEGQLPDKVVLEVTLSCRPHVIIKTLSREDGTHHYT